MDLPLKNMYETFKDEIWKELGPLDHNWFDILTAQTSANEGSGSDQDELCANQEGHFKTPLDKTAVDSQLFSTPRVFRHSRIVSPEIEDGQSFSTTQENDTSPWTETQSPYLFQMSKKGVSDTKYEEIQPQSQDSFDPLDTPHKSPMSYAKHISESLGAQINPDISWTSSLNTPPPVPSTLILSKVDESPCPVSVSADKSVVFVRKLFPSLSNPSRIVVAPPKNDNITTDNHDAVLPEVVSSQTLLTQNEGIWQQTLRGANGDGKICSTVASAPDEFQNASSTFLANSSSALRKVKPDRIRWKQFKLSEHDCSSTDISKTNQSNEEHKADEEHSTIPSSPLAKNGSTAISQWSPLNLSEIPPCTAENNILTELQPDFDTRQLVRPPIKITDTGFIRKKRKFVYTVETLKPKVKENETDFQKMNASSGIPDTGPELSSKQSEDAPDEASCCSNERNAEEKQEKSTLENLPSSVQEKVQDLDMSQLHKDFAQDFSQISDSGRTEGVAEDQNHFSPSACLLAMKKAKHQTKQASLHHDYNSISNTGNMSTTNQNYSTNEGTISDSGFQSAVADITHTASSCIVPCSENTGSKTDIHRTTPFPSTHRGNEKSQLKERQTIDSERECQLDMESTLTQLPSSLKGTDDGLNWIPQNGQVHGRLLEKTGVSLPPAHASGFKTASNKGIQISLANLEKARNLFEERDGDQPTKCNSATKHKNSQSNGSMKSTVSVSNQQTSVSERFEGISCHLTASQKADVTELCTLLEEADSQFEFTQFRGAEVKQPCQENACFLEKPDKDLDPDFLADIDFDDSFSSDAEKHFAITAMPDKMTCVVDEKANSGTSNITDKSVSSSVKRENISAGDVLSSSENIPGRSNWLISTKQKSLHRAEHGEASKMEKPNPLMLSVAFKTAGGNALRVSKTCLSKARALFADLEINVSDLNMSHKQAAETDAKSKKMCNVDSETATDDFKFTLKDDCHVEEKTWTCFSNTKQPVSALKQARNMQDKDTTKSFEICKKDAIVNIEFENVNSGLSRPHPDDIEMKSVGCNTVLEFKNPVSFHETPFSTSKLLPCPASKSIDSSAISELSSGYGFCTASGKTVSVSADAMKKAKCLLNDTYTLEDTSKKISQKENALRTAQLTAQNKESIPKTSGFDTATGKGVSISSTAHKKAKCPLSESDKVYHKINAKPSNYKIPVYGPPPSNVGFLAASGKKIAFSSKALQKAKALFSDISFSADSPAGPHPKNSDKKNDNCEHPDKMQSGLTAGEENVHVSEKHILKDFEDSVLTNAMQETVDCDIDVNNGGNIVHISGSDSDLGIRPDQRVTSNISVESANKQVKQKDSLPLKSSGFGPVSGKGVSISSEALKRATSLLGQCDEVNNKINVNQSHLKTSVYSPLPTSGGFHAASGKALTLSSEALQKAKTLFSDIISSAESPVVPHTLSIKNCAKSGNGCAEDKNKQLGKKEASFPLQSGGFQTASGKGLAISSEALKKAKSLLVEFDELGDRSGKPSCSKTPVPENGGFLAASGKPVALSSEALQKAKTLFSDIISSAESPHAKNGDKNHDNCEPMAKMQSGFKTAGGKKVHVSQKDLLNAKHLLKDLDDSVFTKAMQMAEDCDMDVNNGISAKHKSVAPMIGTGSDEKNLPETRLQQKATLGFSVESEKRYTKDKDKQAEQKNDTLSLQTASGKGVTIASEALRKARSLLGECDEVEDKIGINPSCSKIPVHDSLPQNGGFCAASGKPVALSSEALERAKALFGDIGISAEIPHAKNSHKKYDYGENTRKMQCSSKTVGEKVYVSEQNLLKAKHLLKEADDTVSKKAMQEEDGFAKDCNMDINYGISVKHDNTLSISDIYKDSGNGCTEVTNEHMKQKNTWPQQSVGFQTASGKGVAVSSEALKRAKTLLSECEGVEDKISITAPQGKISAHGPPFSSSGFLAAGVKPVALSSEAMQKAKALFSDISQSRDTPAVAHTRKNDKKIDAHNGEEMHCGFSTAGGVKVQVSKKSLLKATSLFKEFDDGECHDSLLFSTSPQDNPMPNLSKVEDVEGPSGSNLSTASDKYMSTKGTASLVVQSVPSLQESDLQIENLHGCKQGHGCTSVNNKAAKDAFKFQEDTITPFGAGTLHDCPEEEMQCLLDYEINKESSTKESKILKPNESSVLNFQSLNLTGCTETQQEFLAQEALDCTKALLEDEGLADHNLLMALENMPLQHNTSADGCQESEKRRGKRSVEDTEMNGQPPLKRRLLEEFDRSLIDPKASTLHPVKSCSNGLMKDRGVFKYSTSLYPNITRPHSGKNYVETRFQKTPQIQNSTMGDPRSKSAHYKTSAFVPPFVRNAKTETHKNMVLKDSIRTPSAFVPPFKKQRTIVQESSCKAHEGEDKHQKPFVMSSNSKCFVPPTKKTQGDADGTAVAPAQSDDMNNQSLPVDFRSDSAGGETSGVDGTCSRSQDVYWNLQNTELAQDMQDMRIRKKKRQNIRPLPGSLYLKKTSGVPRIPLKAAVNGKIPGRYTPKKLYGYGVQKYVSDITSENAESFRFNLLQFIKREAFTDEGGVQLADGGWLVPSNDGTAGKEEFYRALCDTLGVDPKLISEAWVYNHYRWIVWKQASMEKSFPEIVGSRCLTPEQVLLQLKYRYDVEVDRSRRPALRKIMEKDDTAAKTLVLCVCEIISRGHSPKTQSHNDTKTPHSADAKVETSAALIWLTDGWYAIKAQLDEPLTAMVHKGRLAVGGKLIIHGAQLVGSQDACSPLEAPESLMLKICANSCRPARWDAKLGFHKDPRPFLLPISCLYSNGGPVGCVDIVVLRSYPMQWMERKPDGSVVFRSSRAEEKEARRYNSHKQKAMEILFAKIQSQFENEEKGNIKQQRRRKTISHQEIANLQDGEELYEAVGDDPAYLETHLSAQQLEALHTYRCSLMEKKQAELQDRYHRALEAEDNEMNCPKREVTPVWRLCIADSMELPGRVYQLNLWRPSSDLHSLLKEGCRFKVYNLTTSDGKKRSSIEAVQLTGTKKTQFQELQASHEWLSTYFQPRVCTNFVNLQNPDFEPLCGEIDLAGYVITVVDGKGSSPAFYLADEKLNFVKVRCFSSLSQTGLEDVVKPRVILALSNLQLRGQSMHPTPVVYAGDLTSFSTNPKEVHLQESFSQLKTLVQCQENFFVTAEEKLSELVRSNALSSSSSPALQRQTPASLTDRRQDIKSSVISQKPGRNLGSFTPVGRKSPTPTSSGEKDPKSLKRRRAQDYLSRIPSPPPLSHLGSVASPCVNKTFNPPRRSVTPSTLKTVQTPSHKPADSLGEDEWVNDEELAMIDTQALRVNLI
ncbi:breast cancer type 2 susceptibility protein isoform X1 [Oreochromis aureus]|uniref:Tower domain-containing protein n=2 Tax=Oreochromis aureus TaxID=47969 RepID=A0AAZ1XDC5_OREAU|nr:breast cancer type 2 susceptibility protein isoform X1 [Oreochromis aureus]